VQRDLVLGTAGPAKRGRNELRYRDDAIGGGECAPATLDLRIVSGGDGDVHAVVRDHERNA
jgi:hypothetical protein